jgi:hypothetical protein
MVRRRAGRRLTVPCGLRILTSGHAGTAPGVSPEAFGACRFRRATPEAPGLQAGVPMRNRWAGRGFALAALAVLVAAPGALHGQLPAERNFHSGTRIGIGYSGSLPDALAGAGAWILFGERRLGAFVDGKVTVPGVKSDRNFCPAAIQECTAAWVAANRRNDFAEREKDDRVQLNGGLIYALSPDFALKAGGGLVRTNRYRRYIDSRDDPDERVTPEGVYWVPVGPRDHMQAQAVIGAMIRAGDRFALSFSYETAITGMTLGAFLVVP